MYIAKLKDGPNGVKKTFSMILERVFETVWWRGGGGMEAHQIGFLKLNYFSPLKILDSLLIWRDSWSFLFASFFHAPSLEDTGGFMIFEEKITSSKTSFKWLQYAGGGRILQNGVMHTNMAKPWLWRWGSCGHIGGGCIFWSGGMHANIFGWG
jgi:hypothetical protein